MKKTRFLSQKFGKFGKSLEKVRKYFSNSSEKIQKFWKFGNSKLSKNYEKMTFNSKFENCKKLVPTRKPTQKFG